jgi:polysaccharide export outer membrane protein
VEHFAERRFSVLGQVQKPGSFEFPQNESVNLLEAIAIAGGYTRLGNPSKVDVQRIENGVPKIHHCDAGKMAKDPDPKKKQFEILPDDIINVGERTF